ncbi:MAG TPA: DUF481 domain-containing protein, partial [Polyangiaceae bacterium]|nr:DUF481 domain-containing protein [Polyangiaceae bacterium]
SRLAWDLDLGGGYQYTNYDSAPPGAEDTSKEGIVQLGTRFETEPWPGVDLDVSWRSFIAVTDLERTYHQGSLSLAVEPHDIFEVKLAVFYDRTEQPVSDEDGLVPDKNDLRLVGGLGVDLW